MKIYINFPIVYIKTTVHSHQLCFSLIVAEQVVFHYR